MNKLETTYGLICLLQACKVSHSSCSWAAWTVSPSRTRWQRWDTGSRRRRRGWCSQSSWCCARPPPCHCGRIRWGATSGCTRLGARTQTVRWKNVQFSFRAFQRGSSFFGGSEESCSFTLWGAYTPSTTAAAGPKGMLRSGSPSRWGSGSARRTAEALRSDLTGDGGTRALSTRGSSSLRRRKSRRKQWSWKTGRGPEGTVSCSKNLLVKTMSRMIAMSMKRNWKSPRLLRIWPTKAGRLHQKHFLNLQYLSSASYWAQQYAQSRAESQ